MRGRVEFDVTRGAVVIYRETIFPVSGCMRYDVLRSKSAGEYCDSLNCYGFEVNVVFNG